MGARRGRRHAPGLVVGVRGVPRVRARARAAPTFHITCVVLRLIAFCSVPPSFVSTLSKDFIGSPASLRMSTHATTWSSGWAGLVVGAGASAASDLCMHCVHAGAGAAQARGNQRCVVETGNTTRTALAAHRAKHTRRARSRARGYTLATHASIWARVLYVVLHMQQSCFGRVVRRDMVAQQLGRLQPSNLDLGNTGRSFALPGASFTTFTVAERRQCCFVAPPCRAECGTAAPLRQRLQGDVCHHTSPVRSWRLGVLKKRGTYDR